MNGGGGLFSEFYCRYFTLFHDVTAAGPTCEWQMFVITVDESET